MDHRYYFQKISQIPRSSYHEKAIADFLVDFARERGLKVTRDAMDNVVIFKDAHPKSSSDKVVMVQAHTDMVAAKSETSPHDFLKDPLHLIEEKGWLRADQTTLGADNGVGVAAILALLSEDKWVHPALEAVFTVQEEVGLLGAKGLDLSFSKASYLIGLDAMGEDRVTISSSGGVRAQVTLDLGSHQVYDQKLVLHLSGLIGGHSGEMIDQERLNSLVLAGQLIQGLAQTFSLAFSHLTGGNKTNAIAQDFTLTMAGEGINEKAVASYLKDFEEGARALSQGQEKDLALTFDLMDQPCFGYQAKVGDLLTLLPNGVFHKSIRQDLVLSSGNLGVASCQDGLFKLDMSLRSPFPSMLEESQLKIESLCSLLGAKVRYYSAYPGWFASKDSPLLAKAKDVFAHKYQKPLIEEAVHGGLELGIFYDKKPDLDIIGLGPIMEGIHTPMERLDLASFDRFYDFLKDLIECL